MNIPFTEKQLIEYINSVRYSNTNLVVSKLISHHLLFGHTSISKVIQFKNNKDEIDNVIIDVAYIEEFIIKKRDERINKIIL